MLPLITIDQNLLVERLRIDFKFGGHVLHWFHSYLSDRTQSVIINNVHMSAKNTSRFGVPQGSVLGPLLHTKPLSDLIHSYGFDFHMFADDPQLYFSL